MKTREMNSHSLPDMLRFGAVVVIALMGLVILTEGAKFNRGYTLVSKPRTKPREIRGLRPQSLSTAIGFGKRGNDLQSSVPDSSMIISSDKNLSHSFPIYWFLQYLKNNPELASKIERQLLSQVNDDETNNNDVVKPPATHRYKKARADDESYYLNE